MTTESVRIWRPGDADGVLLMTGQTTAYSVDPRDEYVLGVVTGRPMRVRRGRERHLVTPGQAVAWDPSDRHTGEAPGGKPWSARLMVLAAAELHRLAGDEEDEPVLGDVLLHEPVITDRQLAESFLRLHRALEGSATRLECDERLAAWLRSLIDSYSPPRSSRSALTPRDDRALSLASDYLATHSAQNIGLEELGHAAGIGKFRLVRLFREQTGVTPHALHIAHRIRAARRMLERGETIANTAAATGFADQSHLHRHFTRSLGLTPGEYKRRVM